MTADARSVAGAAIYSRTILSVYDIGVLGFSNTFVWKCPTSQILSFYDDHVSANHLDVGVGTGYFLDKCEFPLESPRITLFDLNRNSLRATAKRIGRYKPSVYQGDILKPLDLPHKYGSIGLNYLLHCLPGDMVAKGIVFQHVKAWLERGGCVFGTTILGQGVDQNILARGLMGVYNRKGYFSNSEDSLVGLESVLADSFASYETRVVGCVAFFWAYL